jgi:hypothetical protein
MGQISEWLTPTEFASPILAQVISLLDDGDKQAFANVFQRQGVPSARQSKAPILWKGEADRSVAQALAEELSTLLVATKSGPADITTNGSKVDNTDVSTVLSKVVSTGMARLSELIRALEGLAMPGCPSFQEACSQLNPGLASHPLFEAPGVAIDRVVASSAGDTVIASQSVLADEPTVEPTPVESLEPRVTSLAEQLGDTHGPHVSAGYLQSAKTIAHESYKIAVIGTNNSDQSELVSSLTGVSLRSTGILIVNKPGQTVPRLTFNPAPYAAAIRLLKEFAPSSNVRPGRIYKAKRALDIWPSYDAAVKMPEGGQIGQISVGDQIGPVLEWKEITRLKQVAYSVKVEGAVGRTDEMTKMLNGVFKPTYTTCLSRPVYIKEDGKAYMEYGGENADSWLVTATSDRGNHGKAQMQACHQASYPFDVPDVWQCMNGQHANMLIQKSVSVEAKLRPLVQSTKAIIVKLPGFQEAWVSTQCTAQKPRRSQAELAKSLRAAISKGVPLWNAKDTAACATLYKGVAEEYADLEPRLAAAVAECEGKSTDSAKDSQGWILRRAMDATLASPGPEPEDMSTNAAPDAVLEWINQAKTTKNTNGAVDNIIGDSSDYDNRPILDALDLALKDARSKDERRSLDEKLSLERRHLESLRSWIRSFEMGLTADELSLYFKIGNARDSERWLLERIDKGQGSFEGHEDRISSRLVSFCTVHRMARRLLAYATKSRSTVLNILRGSVLADDLSHCTGQMLSDFNSYNKIEVEMTISQRFPNGLGSLSIVDLTASSSGSGFAHDEMLATYAEQVVQKADVLIVMTESCTSTKSDDFSMRLAKASSNNNVVVLDNLPQGYKKQRDTEVKKTVQKPTVALVAADHKEHVADVHGKLARQFEVSNGIKMTEFLGLC